MINEYPNVRSVAPFLLPDAQIDITLCVRRGLLKDAYAEDIECYATRDGLQDGVRLATYRKVLHLDIREILGLSPDCEIERLTPEQENALGMFVIERFSLLKNLELEITISYKVTDHFCIVIISGDGVKGLTLSKIVKTIMDT